MKNQLLSLLLLSSLLLGSNAFHSRSDLSGVRKPTNNNQLPANALLKDTSLNAHTHKFKNFEEVLAAYHEQPLMVMFTAVNCGPCRIMKKELKEVRDQVGPDLKMFSIDTAQYPHVGARFHVGALPCLMLVQNGETILRIEGVQRADTIVQQIHTMTTPL